MSYFDSISETNITTFNGNYYVVLISKMKVSNGIRKHTAG